MAKRRLRIASGALIYVVDERKEFVIRRRDGLICYLIASTLLQVATEIERLIEHK